MKIRFFFFIAFTVFVTSCGAGKKTASLSPSGTTAQPVSEVKDEPAKKELPVPARYNPSATRINDIIHTTLEVSFDYSLQRLQGKATLTIKPHFYPVKELVLDAKNFDFHKVGILQKGVFSARPYTYDSLQVTLALDREYTRDEQYSVYIEYTAKPNERKAGGSAAISSDKGLYFVNPDSAVAGKHVEIWTQGETEANSCWFPTVDKPNEKMAHDIHMTVPAAFKSLSNGLLVKSTTHTNGTRTDHWKMSLSHAPYLVMMTVGDYAVVKDTWQRPSDGKLIEVSYYVEKEYEPYARDIFGETPAMLDYFSQLLGVEYPWEKYAQVVVRDFVSGAMENTTATIHGDFLYRTKRELLDGHNQAIIAHELFHHWFGNLVTCESWANLPLNESFANYSQYLWDEHRYGADEADHHALTEMNGYLMSAKQTGEFDMIRFDYLEKEQMFDAHSYNKGGRILHMLRNVLGDEAFFASLKLYLTRHAYKTAEIHDLRLAFEEVTGQDLNWFFNQWFLASGHPDLRITQDYDAASGLLRVTVEQRQKFDKTPLYRLPFAIDIYTAGKKERHQVLAENVKETFEFKVASQPLLVNVDADKVLLCEKRDVKPMEQWMYQYYNAPRYLDRREAIDECAKSSDSRAQRVLIDALGDRSRFIRQLAARNLKRALKTNGEEIKTKLSDMALNDADASARSAAVKNLLKYFPEDASLVSVYEKGVADQSYEVMGASIVALAKSNPDKALELARRYEKENNNNIRTAISEIYAERGGAGEHAFFLENAKTVSGMYTFSFMSTYLSYLKRQNDEEINKGIEVFTGLAENGSSWWLRFSGYQMLSGLQSFYARKEMELKAKAESLTKEGSRAEADRAETESKTAAAQSDKITRLIEELRAKETDENLNRYLRD